MDVLATRVSVGVISGDTLINGIPTDATFQHQVGYVQQQDIHLSTMTVREALEFSAILRQSSEIPREEKLRYVDYVIDVLEIFISSKEEIIEQPPGILWTKSTPRI